MRCICAASRRRESPASDRLALADAIEDARISREKAARIATVIVDAIHDNVATKADVQASEASLRSLVVSETSRLDTRIERLDAKVERIGSRTFNRPVVGISFR